MARGRALLLLTLSGCVVGQPRTVTPGQPIQPSTLAEPAASDDLHGAVANVEAHLGSLGFQRRGEWTRVDLQAGNVAQASIQPIDQRCTVVVVLAANGPIDMQIGSTAPVRSEHPWAAVCGRPDLPNVPLQLSGQGLQLVGTFDAVDGSRMSAPDLAPFFAAGGHRGNSAVANSAVANPTVANPTAASAAVANPTAGAPESSAPANPQEEARTHFQAGLEHARGEDWDRAVTAFEASLALSWRESTAMNLAAAYVRRERFAEAHRLYARLLPEARGQQRRVVRRSLRELADQVAMLDVRVPEGSTVVVDGVVLDASQEIALDPGEHRAQVHSRGTITREARITLRAGQRVVLDPSTAP